MNEIKQKVEELEEVYNKNVIYVKNNINIPELIKDFKSLAPSEPDFQTINMCENHIYSIDLNIVLQQWKYSVLHDDNTSADVFKRYLQQIYPDNLIMTMEEILCYERQATRNI